MVRSWKQAGLVLFVALTSLVIVADVDAWPFRRRRNFNRNTGSYNVRTTNYGAAYGTAGVYGTTNAGVGGGVQAGIPAPPAPPDGASITAPGGGVQAAGYSADAGLGAQAKLAAPGTGADANLRVRGQSPNGADAPDAAPRRSDFDAPPPVPRQDLQAPRAPAPNDPPTAPDAPPAPAP